MSSGPSALLTVCDQLEAVLHGAARREIIDGVVASGAAAGALGRLRGAMREHSFRSGSGTISLGKSVRKLDNRTRQDGFRVLHNWDHAKHVFTDDIVPVRMLDYFVDGGADLESRAPLEILLDYYFLHLLTLCAMRAWDDPEPDAVLDRVTGLVIALQGLDGSGHQFVRDAETLIIYGLSQFHPEEQAYDRLIEKVVGLREPRQVTFALASAAVLSAHLRWGFWLMYDRDVIRMRADNVGDYSWLLSSVVTLMREYVRLLDAQAADPERDAIVEGLLQGLAADPWAFEGRPPPALKPYASEYEELRAMLGKHGRVLVDDLRAHAPSKESYAPLALHFNFPHNTLVAIVAMALADGVPQRIALNALFERGGPDEAEGCGPEEREALARALMAYSGASPDRLGVRGAMLVAYDPLSAMRSFSMTVDSVVRGLAAG